MVRLILSGCNGKMGRVITRCAAERCDCSVVAGFDLNTESHAGFPVYANPANCSLEADVIVDFSHPSALSGVLAYALDKRLPLVVATTGLDENQVLKLRDAAASIPVFFSANMSMGISLIMDLAKKAASVLGGDFDVEILEKHHNQKVDAPSGTALALADSINHALDDAYSYTYDRSQHRKKREKTEIGISAVRGGTIVGDHDVIFAGTDEVITFSHTAYSKAIFGKGALQAALFLAGKEPGMYDMQDVIG